MMAGLSVKFTALDEISAKFDNMAKAGTKATEAFSNMERTGDKAMDNVASNMDNVTQGMKNTTTATDNCSDAMENYDIACSKAADAMEEYENACNQISKATEDVASNQSQVEESMSGISTSTDKAKESMKKYTDETERLGEQSKKTSKEASSAMSGLSQVITAFGLSTAISKIKDELKECSVEAENFETMAAKLSTIADTTVISMNTLSAQAMKTSRDTATDINQLTDTAYNAISAGVNTANAFSTVEDATRLATSGFTSSASALSVLTTTLNAYKLSADETTNISDSLIMTQNLGVMTIDQLSTSMGKAISTASAYSIDLYNLEAGYISLTKAGISVEESTTYISSMFKELGDSGSDIAEIIQNETGKSFGELMKSGYTLADVMQILYNNVEGNSEALMNLWSSAEAGKAANAIVSQGLSTFNSNLEKVRNSAGATEKAYEAMTNTSSYATQRVENSSKNLSITLGSSLNPAISKVKNAWADTMDKFSDFVSKYPSVSAALAGIAIGIGGVTTAVAAYTAVSGAVKILGSTFTALGVSFTSLLGPAALAAAGIAAVSAAVIYFTKKSSEAATVDDHLTSSSRKLQEEIESLNDEYDREVELHGENSDRAYALKNRIDDLTESYNESRKTLGEFSQELESQAQTLEQINSKYKETIQQNGQLEQASLSLVTKLSVLSTKSSHTDEELELMDSIVNTLNTSYQGLNLTLDKTTGKLNMSISDLYKAVRDAADAENKQTQTNKLVELMKQFDDVKGARDEAYKAVGDTYDKWQQEEDSWAERHPKLKAMGVGSSTSSIVMDAFDDWQKASEQSHTASDNYNTLVESMEECYRALGYTDEEIKNQIKLMEEAGSKSEAYAQVTSTNVDSSTAVSTAIGEVSSKLKEIAENYDKAYASALSSIQGQMSLWDTQDAVVAMSADSINTAMQSQINYWNSYSENLDILIAKSGDIEGLRTVLNNVADGSADSAAMIAGMANMSDEQLSAMVEQYGTLQASQDATAESMAELETSFSVALDSILSDMDDTVNGMNMEDNAREAAIETMNGYIQGIKSKLPEVNSAIEAISWAKSNIDTFVPHAEGGIFSTPHYGVFAEDGPESFIPIDGSKRSVDIWEQTGKLLGTIGNDNEVDNYISTQNNTEMVLTREVNTKETPILLPSDNGSQQVPVVTDTQDKTVTLKIEGSGNLQVGSNLSKNDVVEILMDNVKEAIMGIIEQEILEEGVGSYVF